MLKIVSSNRFKKDLKLALRRGYNIRLLEEVVNKLAQGVPLEPKHRDHELSGDFKGLRECHVLPDWLLVYQVIEDELVLFLARTGTHSDLF
ncbi:MAG: type II toxin-antitoxin system YafQ family toxin [Clostridia bacterium]|nr:type II toxin-antitoxin system YafQ family toxin [Clostridia bacterium]